MTEPLAPLTDEDLSAVLDGEADASVAARVDADPAATARLAQLRSASQVLRTAPVAPLAPSVVDDLIGRALAAADEVPAAGAPPAPDGPPGPPGVVLPLQAPPRRRAGAMPPWLVAAAVVLLVGVGLVLVWSGRDTGSSDQDVAAKTTEPADVGGTGGASDQAEDTEGEVAGEPPAAAVPDPSAPHGVPTTLGRGNGSDPADLLSLGTFADADELREALKDSFPTSAAEPGDDLDQDLTVASVERCDTQVRTILSIEGQARNEGVATVDDKQVLVYEYDFTDDDGSATTLVAAVYPAACDQVLTFVR